MLNKRVADQLTGVLQDIIELSKEAVDSFHTSDQVTMTSRVRKFLDLATSSGALPWPDDLANRQQTELIKNGVLLIIEGCYDQSPVEMHRKLDELLAHASSETIETAFARYEAIRFHEPRD